MQKYLIAIVAATALAAASSAGAAPQARPTTRGTAATVLEMRLRSVEIQVDIMADRGMIGREEARDLKQQAYRIERRLRGASKRDQADAALALDRLQAHLRFASDTAELGALASSRRALGRFDDGDRYRRVDETPDRGSFHRPDPRGDPFAIWQERDDREQH